jgi:hypothetical protein
MSDNLRRYRAIRDTLTQWNPGQPTGTVAWPGHGAVLLGQGVARALVSGQQSGNSRGGVSLVSQALPHEIFFSDQKSRGFHIPKSHISDPQRLSRLLIVAC